MTNPVDSGDPLNGGRLSAEKAGGMADHDLLVVTAVQMSNLTASLTGCQQAHAKESTSLWEAIRGVVSTVDQARGGIGAIKWVVGVGVVMPSTILGVLSIIQLAR